MNKIQNIRKQKGLTVIGWLFVIGLAGLILISVFKVLPMYMEYYKVVTLLKSLKEDSKIDMKSKRAIQEVMKKRLYIDDIRSVKKENIIIDTKGGVTTITVKYETRETYISNLFIGAEFEHTVEIIR